MPEPMPTPAAPRAGGPAQRRAGACLGGGLHGDRPRAAVHRGEELLLRSLYKYVCFVCCVLFQVGEELPGTEVMNTSIRTGSRSLLTVRPRRDFNIQGDASGHRRAFLTMCE